MPAAKYTFMQAQLKRLMAHLAKAIEAGDNCGDDPMYFESEMAVPFGDCIATFNLSLQLRACEENESSSV